MNNVEQQLKSNNVEVCQKPVKINVEVWKRNELMEHNVAVWKETIFRTDDKL